MTNITIKASTSIEDLRDAGIVPDWMAEDCEEHGKREIVTELGRRGTQKPTIPQIGSSSAPPSYIGT